MEFNSLEKENLNALDNLRGLACFVGSRTRYFIHDGRIHPHFVGPGDHYFPDSGHSGAANDFLIVEKNK
jgi:hypothetical protein